MSLQAIETTPNDGKPVFLVDQDTGDMTAAHWAARQGVSFQTEGASIALSATHWRLARKTGKRLRRVIARGSGIAEVCVVLLSVSARVPLLCWPRLATRACCDRGACAESPVILR